jgi:hypothetical protein
MRTVVYTQFTVLTLIPDHWDELSLKTLEYTTAFVNSVSLKSLTKNINILYCLNLNDASIATSKVHRINYAFL